MWELELSHLVAVSALSAHPSADLSKANSQLRTLRLAALATMPFITEGKTGSEVIEDERQAAIKAFKEMKEKMLKPKLQPREGVNA